MNITPEMAHDWCEKHKEELDILANHVLITGLVQVSAISLLKKAPTIKNLVTEIAATISIGYALGRLQSQEQSQKEIDELERMARG